ncbi:MAG TPA: hypothetical protein VF469_20185 [Kofleriaceae bacterium]
MRARARFFVGLFLVVSLTPAFAQAPGWVLYTHPDKLMSVRFPEKPSETDQETPTAIGTIHFKLAMFSNGDRAYVATAVVYPVQGKFDVKKALDGARDQALANIKGKVISEKPMKLDGFDGRQVLFEASGDDQHHIRGVVRLFASAKPPSAYMASAMQMTGKPDPDAQKFLDSLHLGKKTETRP